MKVFAYLRVAPKVFADVWRLWRSSGGVEDFMRRVTAMQAAAREMKAGLELPGASAARCHALSSEFDRCAAPAGHDGEHVATNAAGAVCLSWID